MQEKRSRRLPEALLLLAPGCAHCPVVLEGLSLLLKQGKLARIEAVNIAADPDAARAVGTRSVPWCRIGPFELQGLHSPEELATWAAHAAAGTGTSEYLASLLADRRLERVIEMVRDDPVLLRHLVGLMSDLDTPLGVRIGVGAVFEEVAEDGLLQDLVHDLGALTRSAEPQIRADACHYLGLAGTASARSYLEPLEEDADAEVRQIARESLALLSN